MIITLEAVREELQRLLKDPEWLKTRSGKELAFLEMIRSKKDLGFSYFVVYTCDAIHLIDTNDKYNARRWSFPSDRYYEIEVSLGRLTLMDTYTGKENRVFVNGQTYTNDVKCTTGFTTDGSRAYRSIKIRYDYGFRSATIKMSHLVAGLLEGEIAIFSMGEDHILDTHHKDRNHKKDSRTNIKLSHTDEHKAFHKELGKNLRKK